MSDNGLNRLTMLLAGIGLGSMASHFLDPDRGRGRRSRFVARIGRWRRDTTRAIERGARDLGHRASGAVHELGARFKPDCDVPDDVLEARIRSRMGHVLTRPRAVDVRVGGKCVVLEGRVLPEEARDLVCLVHNLAGQREVHTRLQPFEEPVERQAENQRGLVPAQRLLLGGAGGALIASSLVNSRRPASYMLAGAGLALLGRAALRRPVRNVYALSPEAPPVDLQKAINIAAPAERLYEVLAHPENFPLFMPHLAEVRALGDDRYLWRARGPAGVLVEWVAKITEREPGQRIAWVSEEGSALESVGRYDFEENEGQTRVQVRMSYRAPYGLAGDVLAHLFRADPKHELDEGLSRLKTLFETGHTRTASGRVELSQLIAS